ncbi:MAG TPA: hypothetical protein VMZ91_07185 [Candidatus Paceibacterota bacterium]|nr:hypothetical protein [Candidatus Paceibacterota bacterium]
MTKFSLGEIYGLTRSLQKLTDKELPIKVSFRLYQFLKNSAVEMETLEKARVKLVEKYAGAQEEGKEMKVADDKREKFQEEFTSLLNEEVEIPFEPISVEDLGGISISANDLFSMQKIFKEK